MSKPIYIPLLLGIVLFGMAIALSDNNITQHQNNSREKPKHSINNQLQYLGRTPQLDSSMKSLQTTDSIISNTQGVNYKEDSSITKFVSARVPLSNKTYAPGNLQAIESDYIIPNYPMQLRGIALEHLERLAKEFYTVFGKKIVIVSAYRSYGHQKSIATGCSPSLCARPGYSEHQLGLTIDIFAATTSGDFLSKKDFNKYYQRLNKNAHRFGWHNTYQKGVAIDSYQQEPWHRRYLGRDLATTLYNEGLTFAERYNKQET